MDALLKNRRIIQENIKRLQTAFNKLDCEDADPPTVESLTIWFDNLQQQSNNLDQLEIKIIALCDDEDDEDVHFVVFATIRDKIDELKTKMLVLRNSIKTDNPEHSDQDQSGQNSKRVKPDLKLPRIELPKFSGDLYEWSSFHDLFVSSIHNNVSLSGSQKLQYLKSCVQGNALTLIQSFATTNDNYQEAWDILVARFQKVRILVNAQLDRLFSQPTLQTESAEGIRTLIDTANECVRALKVLGRPTEQWDDILVHTITCKLPSITRQEWELTWDKDDMPKFKDLTDHLDQRADALIASSASLPIKGKSQDTKSATTEKKKISVHHVAAKYPCAQCNGSHHITKCQEFTKMSIATRRDRAKQLNLCFNCLNKGHNYQSCERGVCHKCSNRHHTYLHVEKPSGNVPQPQSQPTDSTITTHFTSEPYFPPTVLLSTALVNIKDVNNQNQVCRVLLDGASEFSFISEHCMSRLGLKRRNFKASINALGDVNVGSSKGIATLHLSSKSTKWSTTIVAAILGKVTRTFPRERLDPTTWHHINGLTLADPKFHEPSHIDILLGAEHVALLMRGGRRVGPAGTPIAQESTLGWILSGPLKSNTNSITVHHVQCDLDQTLRKFWELEEVSTPIKHLTPEEQLCESIFTKSHRRDPTGKFIVRLPFRDNVAALGDSRSAAVRRFLNQEKRLLTKPEYQLEYLKFMREYVSLSHMEPVPPHEINHPAEKTFYLPHHYVLKESSTTTKFRVVFDGSAKSTSGISLNQQLMVGPKLQDDIIPLVIRFRTYTVALTADVTKMYRQFLIHKDDQDFQRIVWREKSTEPLRTYRLLTVTYGTASAPYLAVKCLQQLAQENQSKFPLASTAFLNDMFVDDLMSGAMNKNDALQLQSELNQLGELGRIEFRKLVSNDPEVMEAIRPEFRGIDLSSSNQNEGISFCQDKSDSIKALGIRWQPIQDQFSFKVHLPSLTKQVTKRSLLSDIAKLFDPMGWLAPVTIKAKMLMQQSWKDKTGWDEVLTADLSRDWCRYRHDLPLVETIKIPRCITSPNSIGYELHGFSDASKKAYSAVVYLKCIQENKATVNIVAAKTKVAPVSPVTIPRLELCGCVLLVRLIKTIQSSLKLSINRTHCWTDATVALHWIAAEPNRWKCFVANRVAEIQSLSSVHWGHVRGEENPADCASRGVTPQQLSSHPLWWHGPNWLNMTCVPDPNPLPDTDENLVEIERVIHVHHVQLSDFDSNFINKYSSWLKLQRVSAYCLRFIHNSRIKVKAERKLDFLSTKELQQALLIWIKKVQSTHFNIEIDYLSKSKPLPNNSKILQLSPFLDGGVLKVGGRLSKSSIPESQKFPILLPRNHALTLLIVNHYHLTHLHAGPQLLLSTLQNNFWIIRGRDVVRTAVKKCVICARQLAETCKQMMSDLPSARVNPSRPFQKCGVDYAGPFDYYIIRGRGQKTRKCYICLFICFVTKAIHLELVCDMTTEAFISSLKRFVSRRGTPNDIFSDCGTNFVGANNQLKELAKLLNSTNHTKKVSSVAFAIGINWHFNPPSAPHFGGLWEAGVKSVKYHLSREVRRSTLAMDEFTTLLAQIEACLNSRPLSAQSTDPSDLSVLTPGHFLIGGPLIAIPDQDFAEIKINRLSRWQVTQQMLQHFWKRWSSEFLNRLQHRPKWIKSSTNIDIGAIVIIKDNNIPPMKWKLGRVIKIHPGSDNKVRVVTLKTADGELLRPIHKLCVLPVE